jgi:hypothetical protein
MRDDDGRERKNNKSRLDYFVRAIMIARDRHGAVTAVQPRRSIPTQPTASSKQQRKKQEPSYQASNTYVGHSKGKTRHAAVAVGGLLVFMAPTTQTFWPRIPASLLFSTHFPFVFLDTLQRLLPMLCDTSYQYVTVGQLQPLWFRGIQLVRCM